MHNRTHAEVTRKRIKKRKNDDCECKLDEGGDLPRCVPTKFPRCAKCAKSHARKNRYPALVQGCLTRGKAKAERTLLYINGMSPSGDLVGVDKKG